LRILLEGVVVHRLDCRPLLGGRRCNRTVAEGDIKKSRCGGGDFRRDLMVGRHQCRCLGADVCRQGLGLRPSRQLNRNRAARVCTRYRKILADGESRGLGILDCIESQPPGRVDLIGTLTGGGRRAAQPISKSADLDQIGGHSLLSCLRAISFPRNSSWRRHVNVRVAKRVLPSRSRVAPMIRRHQGGGRCPTPESATAKAAARWPPFTRRLRRCSVLSRCLSRGTRCRPQITWRRSNAFV
jgi:hypothetical protein